MQKKMSHRSDSWETAGRSALRAGLPGLNTFASGHTHYLCMLVLTNHHYPTPFLNY